MRRKRPADIPDAMPQHLRTFDPDEWPGDVWAAWDAWRAARREWWCEWSDKHPNDHGDAIAFLQEQRAQRPKPPFPGWNIIDAVSRSGSR